MYKKRDGTSGIRGQLYVTKLISLIHFRNKFDESIKDYNLATNVADIGTFHDICIRATVMIKGENKPIAVFIQAKHREGEKVQLTLNSKNDLAKWFSSYLSIRRLFKPGNKDALFEGNFHEIECLFIMYTTAKADHNTKAFKSDFAEKLNSLIGTGDEGLHPCHEDDDIMFLCEIIMKEQFAALAVQLAKFLSDNAKDDDKDGDKCKNNKNDDKDGDKCQNKKNDDKDGDKCQNKNNDHNDGAIMSMNDDLVLLYHVILSQKVLNVSEIKCKNEEEEYRVATFQTDFFDNDDDFIILFKDTLFIEMLRKRKLKELELNRLLSKLFIKPLEISVLSSLIGNVVTFNDKKFKLEFVSKLMSDDLRRQLEEVEVLQSTVNEAIKLAANDILIKRDFKVPVAFGNKDLTISGKEHNVQPSMFIASVIDKLKNKMVDLINASPKDNIIVIDESIGREFLQLNAGLASTIGNILVCDENSKYIKFTNNGELKDFAKRLYTEVQSAIPNMHDYKFHIKVKTFPKLTFDCDDDEDSEMLKDQVTVLAELMGKFISKEDDSIMSMNDGMLRYHVLVVQRAIEVSEIQSLNEDDEHRLASFRQDFFESDEEFDILLKRALYNEILKIRKLDENEIDLAAKEILTSRSFKVPTAFGNKDLTIKIKENNTEIVLDYLKSKISELIKTKSNADKVVTLDESLEDGLKKTNGGIAGIVGNILVFEENTKLMKFTDNWESLGEFSKRLFIKLQNGIENLHEYKFDVKVKKFPKLSFMRDEDDEDLAKDFLKKLLFFTNQADEKGVEKFLKDEIGDRQCVNVNNVRVTADALFLQYHDLIQRWWMLKEASFVTKQSKHYETALAAIIDKPLMTILSNMYIIKIKNNANYTFNENALNYLKLKDQPPATIFVTESTALTVAKILQSLKKNNYYVFDLEYVLELPAKDYRTVCKELTEKNTNKLIQLNLIIIVCNNINRNWIKRLESIAKVLENKRTIFVLKETLVETIKTYFKANNIVTDEKCNLIQMSEESQKNILENAKVMFQDIEVNLDSIIDEKSKAFVEGEVLSKIMKKEPIVLGKSNSNSHYEKVKHLYIDRRVIHANSSGPIQIIIYKRFILYTGTILRTLNDIGNEVLITAKPGMGKSTLLTHLSLKTKELNPKVWIVRINLLIHSEKFSKWQGKKTNIDYLETLKFFCEVLTEKQSKTNDLSIELEEENGDVTLKSCKGDQWTVFELKMFLDYYNRKEIIFLFDGFDEICPMYTDEVLTLLTRVRNFPRTHKMWITSRSYDKILTTLEQEFGDIYEIKHFSNAQQDNYLSNFWKSNIIIRDLTKGQYKNLYSFMEFIIATDAIKNQKESVYNRDTHQVLFMKVCLNFLSYLRKEITVCPEAVVKTFNTLFSNFNYNITFKEDFDTPLHLYLIADYFQTQIKEESIIPNRWNLDINVFTVYDKFIETKLKKIRFQEKNKIDLYNPDNMIIYENVRAVFFSNHRKLGAYAVFYEDAIKIFSGTELREIKETIDKIKEGTEKTGLIHSVANNIPNFIHMTFTEYFAVQYICDLLRTETREDKQKSIWDFILNIVFKRRENVRTVLGYKIKTDEDLRAIVNDHKEIIFDLLLEQGKGVYTYYPNDFSKYLYIKIRESLNEAMDDQLINFVPLLYNLKEKLTEDYINGPETCTPRKKRMTFYDSCHEKRRAFFLNNSSQVEGEASGPVVIPWIKKENTFVCGKHDAKKEHKYKKEQVGGKYASHPRKMAIAQHNAGTLCETEPQRWFSATAGVVTINRPGRLTRSKYRDGPSRVPDDGVDGSVTIQMSEKEMREDSEARRASRKSQIKRNDKKYRTAKKIQRMKRFVRFERGAESTGSSGT